MVAPIELSVPWSRRQAVPGEVLRRPAPGL